ncbi:related to threonine--tRNA ligase [Rhynchosporium agropyri]|uniref:threonine--tRNA ligase n=1 Tax=Rhynchosporium agropyri TaxID=914238 RepID=A0A1E1KLT6_9HELO|nr:related to threonine--tRNA ligase [Rhynchosporium agropyri]
MRSSRALRLLQIRSRPSHASHPISRIQTIRNGYCTSCDPPARTKKAKSTNKTTTTLADHRQLGLEQELFMTSTYNPGSPIFLPNGTKLFTRLTNFLRAQYDNFGFQEVITPTIYKKSLWEKSGHWDNYADDMYSVTGRGASGEKKGRQIGEDEEYGLKPMNCPGHCLIFASKQRSYRDLPLRYADFSPLHRNEVHGALSGLTRVRRFHQDDGHIFCRPSQILEEIKRTLDFIKMTYGVLGLGPYRLALSTRPVDHFIGTIEEWDNAEAALKEALEASGQDWTLNEGDGAFYGPKIDVILKDSDRREHQTATIQLDFQLPKRFDLEYQAPAPELEQKAETTTDPALLEVQGPVTPVMIHRAVLGSVERIMALLIEHHNGHWPFWLNPRQVMIIAVNDSEAVVKYAQKCKRILQGIDSGDETTHGAMRMESQDRISIDLDTSARSLAKKVREARLKRYSIIVVVGQQDISTNRVVVDLRGIPNGEEWLVDDVLLRRAVSDLEMSVEPEIDEPPPGDSKVRRIQVQTTMGSKFIRPLGVPRLEPHQLMNLRISAQQLKFFLLNLNTSYKG